MLYTVAVVPVVLWLRGLVTSCTMGALHVLPVIAIIVVLPGIINGRSPL